MIYHYYNFNIIIYLFIGILYSSDFLEFVSVKNVMIVELFNLLKYLVIVCKLIFIIKRSVNIISTYYYIKLLSNTIWTSVQLPIPQPTVLCFCNVFHEFIIQLIEYNLNTNLRTFHISSVRHWVFSSLAI